MSDKILIRTYKVGCGDCVFVRIPDSDRLYHILIDCGNFFGDSSSELKAAMTDVETLLNDPLVVPEDQRGKLDLLVATHQHWDHIKGFEAAIDTFKRVKIDRIWLTIGMKKDHPQTHQLQALQCQAEKTFARLRSDPGLRLSPSLNALLEMMSMSTQEATNMLRDYLPMHHGINVAYVYRGFEDSLTDEEKKKYLIEFKDPTIRIKILAPENDIDGSYVGHAFAALKDFEEGENCINSLIPDNKRLEYPANISMRQFRQLKTQMMYTSLLAASQSNEVVNNTSVVLLLEWRNKRLLFPGDAEHHSWELMWQKEHTELSNPLNFLKVSHHGSHNGTPYNLNDQNDSINAILDTLLPAANAPNAKAVVSTLAGRIHAVHNPVPLLNLMNELASRVANKYEYSPELGGQPQRTDKEQNNDWIDLEISD